jgi:hypothetical protein
MFIQGIKPTRRRACEVASEQDRGVGGTTSAVHSLPSNLQLKAKNVAVTSETISPEMLPITIPPMNAITVAENGSRAGFVT